MIVRLDVWGIRGRGIPGALLRMATQRRAIRKIPGIDFAKLLGTGSGETFTMRDSDLTHWAILTVWSHASAAEGFDDQPPARAWQDASTEHACITMRPLVSRGSWSGREPFAVPDTKAAPGPIAAITRARIKPHLWWRFWSSVPPVALDLHRDPGVLFTLGIGEAPVGLQGTFSIWRDAAALSEFAYRRPAHADVVTRTHQLQWYSEEMFTRFQVMNIHGFYDGREVVPES